MTAAALSRRAALAGLATLAGGRALAQPFGPACGQQERIVALADLVLERRASLPLLAARRFGASAACLKIRYGKLSAAAVLDFLGALGANELRRPRRYDDLKAAFLIASRGYAAHFAGMEADWEQRLFQPGAHPSALRAALRAPDRAAALDRLAGVDASARRTAEMRLPALLLHAPESERAAIAADAEARGLFGLAGGIGSTLRDPAAWDAFAARRPAEAVEIARVNYFLPALHDRQLARPPTDNAESRAYRAAEPVLLRAAYLSGEADLLLVYVNQTGRFEPAAAAARRLIAAAQAGEVSPLRQPDAAWLLLYRALVAAEGDRARVDSALAYIPLAVSRASRTGATHALALLDLAIATEALRDFVGGRAPPPAPPDRSPGAQPAWDAFVALAQRLRGPGPFRPADQTEREIAAELLFAAGRQGDLVDLVRAAPDDEAVELADDFSRRLDRVCEAHLVLPGEALLGGEILFRFD